MYTVIKNVQIVISLLKQYGIRHIVLSPGTRHIPFIASVESDPFFKCYSIVDERSAAFFGIGLIQELREPVAVCCTSGTAVCNYISAVTEAFYQKLPLVAITADRDAYCLNQLEDQDIPQMSYFKEITKKSVNLPIITSERDYEYSVRLVNDALLELDHHGKGPVHINMQIGIGPQETDFSADKIPEVKKINRHFVNNREDMRQAAERLKKSKKIMVIYGQSSPADEELIKSVEGFFKSYSCIIGVELMSNLNCEGTIDIDNVPHFNSEQFDSECIPDIVITVNGNFLSDYKWALKNSWKFEHWLVCEEGYVADPYKKLTDIFEGTAKDFFNILAEAATEERTDYSYFKAWQNLVDNIPLPGDSYNDIYTVKRFMEAIPENSILHMANSNSVRLAQIFPVKKNVSVYCNRGTNGIDGSMSSFIGAAAVSNKLSFLLIGDLSFFYDMNGLWNRYIGKNIRIMLNNNQAAGIFHYTRTKKLFPNIDMHIAAGNDGVAKAWVESRGFKYLSARNKEEFDEAIAEFVSEESNHPIFLEAFTDTEENASALRQYYSEGNKTNTEDATLKSEMKRFVKRMLRK